MVGIDDYDQQALDGKTGSVRQAETVLRRLRTRAGWDNSHLLQLADLGSRDPGSAQHPSRRILPTRRNLEWAFQTWLRQKASAGDVVLFYYAGRTGSVVRAEEQTQEPRIDYFLMPSDADPQDVAHTGWPLDRALDLYPGKYQVICWLATSVAGPAAPAGGNPRRVAPSGRDWLSRLVRWPGVTAWLAAESLPDPAADNPADLFTQALLQGLGQPDRKSNLAACLRSLQENPKLKARGFQTMGGVPPEWTVWAGDPNPSQAAPRPEMILQVGHADKITGIVSSSDGRTMISASMDSTLRAWSIEQKALTRVLTGHWVGVTALGLSRDGRWLISGGGRSHVLVHDLTQDFAVKQVLRQPHDGRIERVLLLPDGVHFVTVDQNAKTFLWNLSEPVLKPQPWLTDQECLKEAAGGDAETGKVAVLCGSGEIRVMGASGDPADPLILRPSSARFSALALAPDGHWLAAGREDGTILLRDLKTDKQAQQKIAETSITQLAISRRELLAAVHDQGVKLLPISGGLNQSPSIAVSEQPVRVLSFSPSGRTLAMAGDNPEVSLWNVEADRPTRTATLAAAPVVSFLGFSGDNRTLLVGGADGARSGSRPSLQPASTPA